MTYAREYQCMKIHTEYNQMIYTHHNIKQLYKNETIRNENKIPIDNTLFMC
jgi:hypothetical protein